MGMALLLKVLILSCFFLDYVETYQGIIPIGGIFARDDYVSQKAFEYAINQHKRRFKEPFFEFNVTVDKININDNFQLASAICRQMSEGVFAIIGQKTMQSSDIVQAFTSTFHMPYLTPSLSRDTTRKHSLFEIHLKPDFTEALIELIRFLQWDHVHFLYDSDEGLIRLQRIFRSMRNASVDWFSVKRFNDINHVHDDLRQIDRGDINATKSFVLDLSSEEAYKTVLKQIPEVGMNKYGYNYLLGTLDFKSLNLSRYRHGGVNITGFQLIDEETTDNRDFIKEMKKLHVTVPSFDGTNVVPSSAALTVDAVTSLEDTIAAMLGNNSDVFRYTFRRKHVYNYNRTRGVPCTTDPPTPWMHGDTIYDLLKSRNPPGISGRLHFDEKGFRQDYKLGVYTVNLESGPNKLGTWSSGIGFRSMHAPRGKYNYRPPGTGNTTKIITSIISPPFLMKKPVENGEPPLGNDRYEGYAVDLSEHIARLLGFDYIIKLVEDGAYGTKISPNKWNGMIGELIEHKADLAVAPLTITADRERNVDFSKPFMDIGISIMIRKPEVQKPGVFSFMEPLSIQIWMCILVAYVGVSVGLFLVSRFSPIEWKKVEGDNLESFRNEFSLMNSFWFSMGALMFQGSDSCPRSISGRIIGGVWWFFVLITISSYTANLAAFLTIERMLTPIESADDLSKQTEIKYGMIKSGTTFQFFKNSEVQTYARMWNFMSTNPDVLVDTVNDGIQRVRNSKGKYAFLIESSNNEYVNNRKKCNTMKVGPNLNSKGFGIATPRGSEIRDQITLAVLTLKEDGTLHTLHRRWWYEKGECGVDGGSKESGKRSLSLSNVAGVFYILISGLVFSIILGVFEFLYYRSNNTKGSYLRGTETATTLVATPNERDEKYLPYDTYNNDKVLSEYTYSAPGTIGFEGFNTDYNAPIGFEGINEYINVNFKMEMCAYPVGAAYFGESGKRSLSLSNVAGVFYILISGLVFSIILGVFEFLYYRSNNTKGSYLRGTETATTLVATPNERDEKYLPYDTYNNDKVLSEYTYSAPGTIGFEGFNTDYNAPIGFEGINGDNGTTMN